MRHQSPEQADGRGVCRHRNGERLIVWTVDAYGDDLCASVQASKDDQSITTTSISTMHKKGGGGVVCTYRAVNVVVAAAYRARCTQCRSAAAHRHARLARRPMQLRPGCGQFRQYCRQPRLDHVAESHRQDLLQQRSQQR